MADFHGNAKGGRLRVFIDITDSDADAQVLFKDFFVLMDRLMP